MPVFGCSEPPHDGGGFGPPIVSWYRETSPSSEIRTPVREGSAQILTNGDTKTGQLLAASVPDTVVCAFIQH